MNGNRITKKAIFTIHEANYFFSGSEAKVSFVSIPLP